MRVILAILALTCSSANAELYKCVVDGKTTLTDVPCVKKTTQNQDAADDGKTAAEIQAEFEKELADKKAAEEAKKTAEQKEVEDRRKREANRKHYVETIPTRAAEGALQIRNAMRDPDSFKLTLAVADNISGTICYVYRSKNGFGGYVSGSAMLVGYDLMFSKAPGFNGLWEIECTGTGHTDYTAAINRLVF